MNFIVYSPRYDENSGGAIVLHKLCHLLNCIGHNAMLWPIGIPIKVNGKETDFLRQAILYYGTLFCRKPFFMHSGYITPLASKQDINDSIVIYPEVIDDNPLGARRYVRWFLHRPGFHKKKYHYNSGDLYFFYQKAFDHCINNMVCGGQLFVIEYFSDVYVNRNSAKREKVCYMIRKGTNRKDLPNLKNLWVVDNLTHTEMAMAFNNCSYCYFYDTHTLYSTYSAMCGCIPIIVPEKGVSKTEWVSEKKYHYGIAYGEEDINNARNTYPLLIDRIKSDEKNSLDSVKYFADFVSRYFIK